MSRIILEVTILFGTNLQLRPRHKLCSNVLTLATPTTSHKDVKDVSPPVNPFDPLLKAARTMFTTSCSETQTSSALSSL